MKYPFCFFLFAFVIFSATATAQAGTAYIPCNEMPGLIHNYYADVTALNRVYIVEGSPEKRERYKQLAVDYILKLKALDFNTLTQGCKADYILFKRDLDEVIYEAENEVKEFDKVKQWIVCVVKVNYIFSACF